MAFVIFTQSLGSAIILVLCNVIFSSSLVAQLQEQVPRIDAEAVVMAGATGFRAIIQPDHFPNVLVAFANSVDRVFYLAAGVASACAVVLWGMGWHDLRKGDDKKTSTMHQGKPGMNGLIAATQESYWCDVETPHPPDRSS